ncbi:MAG: septal ring lytic transglycosylase RlpA family protein [Magnetospiraceae bacterium]
MKRWVPTAVSLVILLMVLGACAETRFALHTAKRLGGGGSSAHYKVGKPYEIGGIWYTPSEDFTYDETGIASWYGRDFHGRSTANGEIYDMHAMTAAHKTLPLPSIVRVTNLENGRSVEVRVNDRGPFAHGRIIDLSYKAAQVLGFVNQGTAKVRVQNVTHKSLALARGDQSPQVVEGSGIVVESDPKPKVQVAALPGPDSGDTRSDASPAGFPVEVNEVEADTTPSMLPVGPTSIFVQVGAFSQKGNADRLARKLESLVATPQISQITRPDGLTFYRVRLGPLVSVDAADSVLAQVMNIGHPEARIVVD